MRAEEYCIRVTDGTHDTPKPSESGYPLVTSKNIVNGELDLEDTYLISKEDYVDINKRSEVEQWDILFSMIGSVGEVYLHRDENCDFAIKNIGLFKMGGDKEKALKLYYYLKSPYFQRLISVRRTGSIQTFLPLGFLRTIELPNMDEISNNLIKDIEVVQSKIDSNKHYIQLVEEFAQLLFHKWFIDYNFPNEQGKPYKDSGGKMVEVDGKLIPKGWSKKPLEYFIEETFNGDWGKETDYEGAVETCCIRGADMPNIKSGTIGDTPIRYIKNSKDRIKELTHGDIVIEASGGSPTQSTGRTVIIRDSLLSKINKPLYFSNFSKAITPKAEHSMFLYHLLNNLYNRDVFFHYEGKTSGLKNLLLNNMIKRVKFVSPSLELLKRFEEETGVLWDKIFSLGHENELLEETRDLLIHKLIS